LRHPAGSTLFPYTTLFRSPELKQAFETHLEETYGQIERIDQMVEIGGFKLKRIKCAAMEGLVEEGKEAIDEIEKGPVLDAALIGDRKSTRLNSSHVKISYA